MTACIIMHDMIVEDKGVDEKDFKYDDVGEKVTVSNHATPEFDAFIENYKKIKDKETRTASSRPYRALVAQFSRFIYK